MTDSAVITRFLENPYDYAAELKTTKNFERGFEVVNYIHDMVKGADSILDIVIKAMEEAWKPEEHDNEQFYDAMIRKTELAPVTIMRHTRVGEMLSVVPEEYRHKVEALGVKEKIAITDAVLDGHQLTEDQWGRVAHANNYQDVADVAREVTGKNPRSQWMRFVVDEHGIVWIDVPEGRFEFFRFNTDPEVQDVIERGKKRLFRQANITPVIRY